MHLPQGKHYGLIAQDVEQVLPNLIKETKFDTKDAQPPSQGKDDNQQPSETIQFKAVNYTELIPILVKAVQEQQMQIEKQQKENEELRARIENLESLSNTNTSFSAAYLEQNIPNPFANSTTIKYSLPQKFTTAQIRITDKSGKTLKTLNITGTGRGTINVDASILSSGAYNYSLFVDSRLVGTKQMERLR